MKKLLISIGMIATFLIFFCTTSIAQDYKSAVGARLGVPISASFKTKVGESKMIEGTLGFRNSSNFTWINLSADYQIYKPLSDVTDGLYWYYGGGASAFFWTYNDNFIGGSDFNSTSFGVQANAGLDYKFPDKRVNISIDYRPTFFFGGFFSGIGYGYGSLAVRYVLGDE